MIGSFVISVLALLVAVLGCAWVKPIGAREGHSFGTRRASRRQPSLSADDAPSER